MTAGLFFRSYFVSLADRRPQVLGSCLWAIRPHAVHHLFPQFRALRGSTTTRQWTRSTSIYLRANHGCLPPAVPSLPSCAPVLSACRFFPWRPQHNLAPYRPPPMLPSLTSGASGLPNTCGGIFPTGISWDAGHRFFRPIISSESFFIARPCGSYHPSCNRPRDDHRLVNLVNLTTMVFSSSRVNLAPAFPAARLQSDRDFFAWPLKLPPPPRCS